MSEDQAAVAEAPEAPKRKRNQPAPVRIVAIALGVPLILTILFIVLYAAGVLRDENRAKYCAVYAPVSADLQPLDDFEAAVAAGDIVTIIQAVNPLGESLHHLRATAADPAIRSRLKTMNEYVIAVELAARTHDADELAALAAGIGVFQADRKEFLRESAEYCRYR
jgi:hypothetical protein